MTSHVSRPIEKVSTTVENYLWLGTLSQNRWVLLIGSKLATFSWTLAMMAGVAATLMMMGCRRRLCPGQCRGPWWWWRVCWWGRRAMFVDFVWAAAVRSRGLCDPHGNPHCKSSTINKWLFGIQAKRCWLLQREQSRTLALQPVRRICETPSHNWAAQSWSGDSQIGEQRALKWFIMGGARGSVVTKNQ